MAVSKSKEAVVFLSLVEQLQLHANAVEAQARGTGVSTWFSPGFGTDTSNLWSGQLSDTKGMGIPFNREELYEQFRSVVKDADDSGVVGDLIAILFQGDFVASAERAYRARHLSPVRARAHSVARRRGHGHVNGCLQQGMTGYLKHLLKLAAG